MRALEIGATSKTHRNARRAELKRTADKSLLTDIYEWGKNGAYAESRREVDKLRMTCTPPDNVRWAGAREIPVRLGSEKQFSFARAHCQRRRLLCVIYTARDERSFSSVDLRAAAARRVANFAIFWPRSFWR